MRILIDIPELAYESTIRLGRLSCMNDNEIYNWIANATPIPSGYGKLLIVSEDHIKKHMISVRNYQQMFVGEVDLSLATVGTID